MPELGFVEVEKPEIIDRRSLRAYSTKELVEELNKRVGVKENIAKPYETLTISIQGPAILLEITD